VLNRTEIKLSVWVRVI